jgi:uncharacterized protein (TIGR00730 family)
MRTLASASMPTLRRLCVYAGSNAGARPEYAAAAAALAERMAARGIGLVYGGGKVGLMGVLADTILGAGGEAVGVMPQALVNREIAHTGLTELEVVGSMHERKALMAELADGFVAVPGGIGTLEELVEVFTWSQLGIHAKPYGVLDVAGFYAGLSGLLDHMVREGFLRAESRAGLVSASEPGALLERLEAWEPVTVSKWLDLDRS